MNCCFNKKKIKRVTEWTCLIWYHHIISDLLCKLDIYSPSTLQSIWPHIWSCSNSCCLRQNNTSLMVCLHTSGDLCANQSPAVICYPCWWIIKLLIHKSSLRQEANGQLLGCTDFATLESYIIDRQERMLQPVTTSLTGAIMQRKPLETAA